MLVRDDGGVMIGSSVLICGALLLVGGSAGGQTGDVEAKWRREYSLAASRLEETARKVLAKGTYLDRPMHGVTLATNNLTVASSGGKRLLVYEGRFFLDPPPKKPCPSFVQCQTADYAFSLSRRQPDGPFVITDYSQGEADPAFELDFCTCARSATVYSGASLLERMERPSFVLLTAALTQAGGAELVRIDYTVDGEKASESGAVYLDPVLNWAIRKVDITIQEKGLARDGTAKSPMKFTSVVEYQQVGGDAHFPKRVENFLRTDRPDVYQQTRVELTEITVGDVPEGIFKLTAYGLPELPMRPVRTAPFFSLRNPLFWFALATMVVCLAILWRTRRKADKNPAVIAP